MLESAAVANIANPLDLRAYITRRLDHSTGDEMNNTEPNVKNVFRADA